MTRSELEHLLDQVIGMASEYTVETRVRRLIESHFRAGDTPRTLVMNNTTWKQLVWELDGRGYRYGLFWTPQPEGERMDPVGHITTYLGLPILIKEFLPDEEVIIGV